MDDWLAEAGAPDERAAPRRVVRARGADSQVVAELAELARRRERPALVVGAGADDAETWEALVALAERLVCPVWQESFSSRAGFPQDHPLFAGHLPADRIRLRETLAPHDVVLAVGSPVFRQYPFDPRAVRECGNASSRWSAATGRGSPQHRRPRAPGGARRRCAPSSRASCPRARARRPAARAARAARSAGGGRAAARGHVFAAMAERIPRDAIVIEESPSSRPELLERLPARESLGFISPAMGGLGFALPAATGCAWRCPTGRSSRSSATAPPCTPSRRSGAPRSYRAGALFVDPLQRRLRDHGPPRRAGRRHAAVAGLRGRRRGLARAFGCPARRVSEHDELLAALDEVLPGLGGRDEPLLLEVAVAPDSTFAP